MNQFQNQQWQPQGQPVQNQQFQQAPQQQMQNYQQQTPQKQDDGSAIVIQGRYVWGSLGMRNKKIYGTQNDQLDEKGQPIMEVAFGLAVPKPSPQSSQEEVQNFQKLWDALVFQGSKQGFNNPGHGKFAWKFVDGDGRKDDGSPYPEAYRGCFVVTCSTRFPLTICAWEDGKVKQVTEQEIKCGDYLQVALKLQSHPAPNAGIYTNPSYVARFAYGPAIINAPDPSTIFGNQAPPMPVGGSATPIGMPMVGGPNQPNFGGGPGSGFGGTPNSGGFNQPNNQAPQQQQVWNGQGQPGFNGGQQMGGQTQQPAYTPNYGPLPTQFQQQGSAPMAGQGMGGHQGGQPSFVPGMAPQGNGGLPQNQNGYGNAGPNMGQGQPPQGMPMQNMQGQWNPNGYNGQ